MNLQIVAFYGNYTIITDKIAQFVNSFLESSGASIGNLIAEGNRTKILNLFWELLCMRYFIGGLFSFAILILIDPFIQIWLGSEYILPDIVIYLIVINVFLGYTRGGVMQFLFGYGMFADIWAPISEIVINLTVAISCGAKWGLPGVLLGGILSQLLIVGIWKPTYLFRKGFKEPVWHYWLGVLKLLICVSVPAIIISQLIIPYLHINPGAGYMSWVSYALINVGLYALLTLSTMYMTNSGMRRFVNRFIKINSKY